MQQASLMKPTYPKSLTFKVNLLKGDLTKHCMRTFIPFLTLALCVAAGKLLTTKR